jgi:hypothetical protein
MRALNRVHKMLETFVRVSIQIVGGSVPIHELHFLYVGASYVPLLVHVGVEPP